MTRSVNSEVELKLDVDPKRVRRLKRHALLNGAAGRSTPHLTVYYDTAKGALRKHGYSLRVRSANGGFVQTVKPLIETAGLFARDEWESPVDSIEPDLDRLAGLPLESLWRAGKLAKLRPVVRSEVQRTSWRLMAGDSALQVDMDDGEISGGGHSRRLCELELELLEGSAAELIHAARLFAERVPLRVAVLSKAERGFALAEGTLDRVAKAGPVAVDDRMTISEAFTVIAHACIRHYRLNEPLVIATQEPAVLHQARVAMRRLRSSFTLFRTAIRDGEYDRLREELRWFTAQLGDARNLDVYLERELADDVRRSLTARRQKAYRRVIRAMNSQRLRDLMLDLVAWVAVGDWRSRKRASRPIAPFAARRLDKLWSSIAGPATDIAGLGDEARHRLRIQVKKLRYAVEFLRGVFPQGAKKQKQFASAVEGLQEALGKLNDLVTARAMALPAEAFGGQDQDEAEHLAEAKRYARRLTRIGRFWASDAD
ncbi:MAG TPA: CHAD domain-containing protein [Sphingomicrobium sp.]|nr:CHAD domain-containing protein [Sphingomicrobium sp.]